MVVLAARYSTDSLDLLVQEAEGMDPNASNLKASIVASPMMQQELRRQRRDLDALRHGEALGVLRRRARRESILELL